MLIRFLNVILTTFIVTQSVLANDAEDTASAVPVDSSALITENSQLIKAPVVVISEPAEALIIMDGDTIGQTPFTIESVASGSHTLELRKKGHYLKKISFKVESSDTVTLNSILSAPARLVVSTNPSQAEVFIDNISKGTTPVQIKQVKPGEYSLVLRKVGFEQVKKTITLSSAQQDSLHFDLRPVVQSSGQDKNAAISKSEGGISLLSIMTTVLVGLALVIIVLE